MSCKDCVDGVTKNGGTKCEHCLLGLGYTSKQISLMLLKTAEEIVGGHVPNVGVSILPTGTIQYIHGKPFRMSNGRVVFHRPPGGYPKPKTPEKKRKAPPPPPVKKSKADKIANMLDGHVGGMGERKQPPPPPKRKKRKVPPPPPTRGKHA